MSLKIVFNGREYDSVEAMPEGDRRAYEEVMKVFADKNANGVPDILEGDGKNVVTVERSTTIKWDSPRRAASVHLPKVALLMATVAAVVIISSINC